MRPGSNQRTMVEMGLVGVVATQLWHHIYIDGSLADLPTISDFRFPISDFRLPEKKRPIKSAICNLQSAIATNAGRAI
jgi:hypothetical protein